MFPDLLEALAHSEVSLQMYQQTAVLSSIMTMVQALLYVNTSANK